MDYCGFCINYRLDDEGFEHCALDPDRRCAYSFKACSDYKPDEPYINFLNKKKEGYQT